MESTRAQHQPINQPLDFPLPAGMPRNGPAGDAFLAEPFNHGSGAGPLLPGAHRKYILYGCESWETLPPASRLTTAYQSLNRGDSTLGGLGRAAASHRQTDWRGVRKTGLGGRWTGPHSSTHPANQARRCMVSVFKFGLLSFCRLAGPQRRCVCGFVCVFVSLITTVPFKRGNLGRTWKESCSLGVTGPTQHS